MVLLSVLEVRDKGTLLRVLGLIFILLSGCREQAFNSPYVDADRDANVIYSVFGSQPKTLDPARSYTMEEAIFTGQIYEPPLQYHYLKRPYQLEPLTASRLPDVMYMDAKGNVLPESTPAEHVAYSIYTVTIQPGIYYQPHPAFAKDEQGHFLYHHMSERQLKHTHTLSDFEKIDTRELTANDYVYEIKRLASPKTQSPILGLMSEHVYGLEAYANHLQLAFDQFRKTNQKHEFFDLRQYPLAGVEVLDRYHYQVILNNKYPQFIYWLAMPFFAPIPWEADAFYSQPGMQTHNITFDWYPIGTGAYRLIENNPNRRMVLEKNPNFHAEFYPSEGEQGDEEKGYLINKGKRLPLVDRYEFYLEKESIPRWNKFLQGYYDVTSIGQDSFDEAIRIDEQGQPVLTRALQKKNIQLRTGVEPTVYYMGFNMLDPIVGGYSQRAKKLRQAIAIAFDNEEYISIFKNGHGILAHSVIPTEIFGHQAGEAGINTTLFAWKNGKAEKKSLDYAKRLMREAGYPDGRDKHGKPLVLNYEATSNNDPAEHAYFDWFRKQFAKLGIELNVRSTTYNRFQQKMRDGKVQIFSLGWHADYPDPENFLFLFYSPNSQVKYGGENSTNYANKQYDAWYETMRNMQNGDERQAIIDNMVDQINEQAVAIWHYYPLTFTLAHQWYFLRKPMTIGNNDLKYAKVEAITRAAKRQAWNQAMVWPLIVLAVIVAASLLWMLCRYRRRQKRAVQWIGRK
jgi:oligopeptide transport system substrate-binding protein